MVSSGDPGVFAMAAAVFEAVDAGDPAWRDLDIRVLPGISAMFAAAARIGAPLGHDFCAINLSDNLKPWELIERRLRLAAQADFVIALYNPLSKARPWQLGRAFELLREELPETVPVVFASAVSDAKEAIETVTLRDARAERADMRTLVLIGSSRTKLIERGNGRPFVYTPRSAGGFVMTEPAQHLGNALDLFPRGNERPTHHDHRQAELARRFDLCGRGIAAGVAGHHDVDAVIGQHGAVSGEVGTVRAR